MIIIAMARVLGRVISPLFSQREHPSSVNESSFTDKVVCQSALSVTERDEEEMGPDASTMGREVLVWATFK